MAKSADNVLLQGELGRLSIVEILQGDIEVVRDILATASSGAASFTTHGAAKEAAAAATKHLRKHLFLTHASKTESTASSRTVLAVTIIRLTALGVAQCLIGMTIVSRSEQKVELG